MDAEIFEFPSAGGSAWRTMTTGVRDMVRDLGYGDAAARWILEDFKPRFEACHRELDAAVPTEKAAAFAEMVKMTGFDILAPWRAITVAAF